MSDENIPTPQDEQNTPAPTEQNTPEISPEIQAMIDRQIAEALEQNNAARDEQERGLKKNRDDLMSELKKSKDRTRDLQLKKRMMDGNVEEVTKEIEARVQSEYAEKLKNSQDEFDNLKKQNDNIIMNSALDAHLDSLKVKTSLKDARKSELLLKHKVELDETGTVTIDGKSLDDFGAAWLESGANVNDYIVAQPSTGGGSRGGRTPGNKSTAAVLAQLDGRDLFDKALELQKK